MLIIRVLNAEFIFFFFRLKFLAWCSLIVNYFIDLTMQFIRARQQQHKTICNFNKI